MSLSTIEFTKHLCYLLRDGGAQKERLIVTPDGYSKLSDILALRSSRNFAHINVDRVEKMLVDSKTRRFDFIVDSSGELWLRAARFDALI